MGSKQKPYPATQQDLLRDAMNQLGMTREEFAARLSVSRRTLDKWLLPSESSDFRGLPEMGRAYIQEILAWHHNSSSDSVAARGREATANRHEMQKGLT